MAKWLWDWSAEVSTSLFHDAKMCRPHHLIVIHNWVVDGELAIRNALEDPMQLIV
jgi:hypothetical protein